jgi:hypothetical protein
VTRVSIFLIAVALIAGMVSYAARPIEIRDWYDLNAIRDNLGGSYILMNDLSPTSPGYAELASPTASQGKGWLPIGASINQQADHGVLGFGGTFDGQGYEIHDLFINRPDESYVGFFLGVGQEGVVKDIGMVNATVTGNAFVGTLAGWNHGAVRDSYFTGSVTGNYVAGGLVGLNDGTVSNSYSTASVTGNSSIGGLVGASFSGTVSNSYSTGGVTGNNCTGGLVGGNGGGGTVSNSHSIGSVSSSSHVGGLVGWNLYGTVSNSYSTGSVTGSGDNVGGLVGSNIDLATVSNSYSTGSVTGNDDVGGLVGRNEGIVSNSYSTGSVSGSSYAGGLVGSNEVTVSDSFWDVQTSGQAASAGGTGKNTTAMQDIATFSETGWDIVAVANPGTRDPAHIWNIVNGVTYPFLSWEPA